MNPQTKTFIAEEFPNMLNDDCRHELVEGKLEKMPFSDVEHGFVVWNIGGWRLPVAGIFS